MRFLKRALEGDVSNDTEIELKGPLSEVYGRALAIVYANTNDAEVEEDGSVSTEEIHEDKTGKKKKLKLKIKKGSFHEWLGKDPSEPITDKDIEKGLKSSDPHVKRMAQFAKNAKKWHHTKKNKSANEEFNCVAVESMCSDYALKYAGESQQMDSEIMSRMATAVMGTTAPPTDNFTKLWGTSRVDLDDSDVVDITNELVNMPDDREFILVVDYATNDNSIPTEYSEELGKALECIVTAYGGKVFHSLSDAGKYIFK